jgi:hypothetical protein
VAESKEHSRDVELRLERREETVGKLKQDKVKLARTMDKMKKYIRELESFRKVRGAIRVKCARV